MKGGPLLEVVHPASFAALDPQSVDIQTDPARPTSSPTMYAECMKTRRYQPATEHHMQVRQQGKTAGQGHGRGQDVTTEDGRFLTGGQEVGGSNPLSPTRKAGQSRSPQRPALWFLAMYAGCMKLSHRGFYP